MERIAVVVDYKHYVLGEDGTVTGHTLCLAIAEATGCPVLGISDGQNCCTGGENPGNLDLSQNLSVSFSWDGPYYPLPEAAAEFLRDPDSENVHLPLAFELNL